MPRHICIETFRRNLRAWRIIKGYTHETLAKESMVGRSTIIHIELGYNGPSLETAVRLAEALGVPLHILLQDTRKTITDIERYQVIARQSLVGMFKTEEEANYNEYILQQK